MMASSRFFASVLVLVLSAVLALQPSDYKLHGLEKFGVHDDDVMYAGLMPLKLEKNDEGSYFYWHAEHRGEPENKKEDTPLVIWLNGGPGCSSNVGLFYENGPYTMMPNDDPALKYSFNRNPLSWTNVAHMVWVEQPLRTGFSVPSNDKKDPRVTNEFEVAADFHDFLTSFFEVFDHLKNSPLYIMGESYGGRYVPAIAEEIVKRGEISTLKGIGLGNGVIDPIQDTSYTSYAYSHGMIGEGAKKYIDHTVKTCKNKAQQARKTDSFDPCDMQSQVLEAAGHPNEFNTGTYNEYDGVFHGIYNQFFNDPEMQELIHVRGKEGEGGAGAVPGVQFTNGHYTPGGWTSCNDDINTDMTPDTPSSSVPALQYLVKHVRVLLYSGDLDLSCNIMGTTATLESFTWLGQQWSDAERALWRIEGDIKDVAGDYSYLNEGQFGFLVVHKSGHLVPMDRPEVALDLITRLINGQTYADIAIPSDKQYLDMLKGTETNDIVERAIDITTLFFFVATGVVLFMMYHRYYKNTNNNINPANGVDSTPNGRGAYEMVSNVSSGKSTTDTSGGTGYQKL